MTSSIKRKISELKQRFLSCSSPEERYNLIIKLGNELPRLDEAFQIDENRVKGCQSTTYLYTIFQKSKIEILASSDALISQGLMALLISVYNQESPETILTAPPDFLKDLELEDSISPNRVNGLYSAHLKLKQDALKYLLQKQQNTS